MDSDLDYSIADEYLDFEENESDDNEYYPYEFAEGLTDEEYIDTEENLDEELNLKKNYIDLYYYRRENYFDNLNIPDDILDFDDETRYYIFDIRNLYLTLSELNKEQIHYIRKYIEDRKTFDYIMDLIDKANGNININNDNILEENNLELEIDNYINKNLFNSELNNPVYLLLFIKLTNILMRNGKRFIVNKYLTKAFDLLYNLEGITNPLELLMDSLYSNLVPIIKSREILIGSKKRIGVLLNIYQRISLTIKIFVKGIRMHNQPLHFAIAKEILNLIFGKSYLNIHNKNMIKEIEQFKLLKYLELPDDTILMPESIKDDESDDNNLVFSSENLINIDWENFDIIILDLKYIILLENIYFEQKIFKLLKDYIILKYYVPSSSSIYNVPIENKSLIYKYDLGAKHKVFTYIYFNDNYLDIIKENLDFIDLTKYKAFFNKETGELINLEELNELEKKEVLQLKLQYYMFLTYSNIEDEVEGEEDLISNFAFYKNFYKNLNIEGKIKRSKFNFVFWEYLFNPIYLHLEIQNDDIKNFVINNRQNFHYFPCFIAELMSRNENAQKLSEEEFLLLFMGKNPNLLFLDLKVEDFEDIIPISKLFEKRNIWESQEEKEDFFELTKEEKDELSFFGNDILKDKDNPSLKF